MTYAELTSRIDRIAAWLSADGFGAGDRLAVWAPNVPPVAACTLAAISLGGVVTGINPAWTDDEVAIQLRDAGVSVLVTVPAFADRAQAFGLRRVIVFGTAEGAVSLAELLATDADRPRRSIDCDSIALLPYSSGTTGLPKGVMLTHRQLVTVSRQLTRALGVDDHDVTLAVAPWFHILGVTAALLVPLTAGATVVTIAEVRTGPVPRVARSLPGDVSRRPAAHRRFPRPPPERCRTRPQPSRADRQRRRAAGRRHARGVGQPARSVRCRPGVGAHRDERGDLLSRVDRAAPRRAPSARCSRTPSYG